MNSPRPWVRKDRDAVATVAVDETAHMIIINEGLIGAQPHSLWMFPGGKIGAVDDCPATAARRKVWEKTNVMIPPDRIDRIGALLRPTYKLFVFAAFVESLANTPRRGPHDEIVRVCAEEDLMKLHEKGEILRSHSLTIVRLLREFAER